MTIRRGRSLATDHLEGLASCKWSSGGTGLLQMIIRHPVTQVTSARFNLADLSRTICSYCVLVWWKLSSKPDDSKSLSFCLCLFRWFWFKIMFAYLSVSLYFFLCLGLWLEIKMIFAHVCVLSFKSDSRLTLRQIKRSPNGRNATRMFRWEVA